MEITTALFYVFSAIMVLSGLRVITAKNPVHAALFLVLAFFNAAGIWMLLKAEFLAIALVLVYIGAVMVLFLFVVMMLDMNSSNLREGFWTHLPMAAFVGALIAFEMGVVLMGGFQLTEAPVPTAAEVQMGNTKLLGIELYTNYLYPLEIAAVLLLVALIMLIVAVLPDGRLVMERQYRYPMGRVMLEFPAGKLDAGEAPLVCGQRELLEETGYTAAEWAYAGVLHNAIAYSDEGIHIFFARGLSQGTQKRCSFVKYRLNRGVEKNSESHCQFGTAGKGGECIIIKAEEFVASG